MDMEKMFPDALEGLMIMERYFPEIRRGSMNMKPALTDT
jgi:hypothetical protein